MENGKVLTDATHRAVPRRELNFLLVFVLQIEVMLLRRTVVIFYLNALVVSARACRQQHFAPAESCSSKLEVMVNTCSLFTYIMLAVKWLLLFGESKMKIEFWHGFSYVGCAEMLY